MPGYSELLGSIATLEQIITDHLGEREASDGATSTEAQLPAAIGWHQHRVDSRAREAASVGVPVRGVPLRPMRRKKPRPNSPEARALAALEVLAAAARDNERHQRLMLRVTIASVIVAALSVAVTILSLVLG